MIVSAIKGRLRIRDPRFGNLHLTETLKKKLIGKKGVMDVTFNQNSRSLLVRYDADTTGEKALLDMIGGTNTSTQDVIPSPIPTSGG